MNYHDPAMSYERGDHVYLVTTTIRTPVFLNDVFANALKHRHAIPHCLVIGDRKTPREAAAFCARLAARYHGDVRYYPLDEQRRQLAQRPELFKLMPLNHGSRKMIGNFIAYREGCSSLIMLDDDNFVINNDFFAAHSIVDATRKILTVSAKSGWHNIAGAVREKNGVLFFPRGYPWAQRHAKPDPFKMSQSRIRSVVNNGLVLGDPDIDAISRLFWPIEVIGIRKPFRPNFALRPGTWCSFNNQNTALARVAVPVYFTPPATQRNADIWTSFVLCKLAGHMGDAITFGEPLVRQIRNPHDLWDDLEQERVNNKATDRFVAILRSVRLKSGDYQTALQELLDACLAALAAHAHDWPEDASQMMFDFFKQYKIWLRLFKNLPSIGR